MLCRLIPAVFAVFVSFTATAQQTEYTISHVAGDVYEFSRRSRGTFMITKEGAVVVDPHSVEVAEWLKAEIWNRFKKRVTHVLHSHYHWDHASGGATFPSATVIAHANMVKNLTPPAQDAPLASDGRAFYDDRFANWDSNGNNDGLVQIDELPQRAANLLADADLNDDGDLSLFEIHSRQHRDVRRPDETFDSRVYRLNTGGKLVEMHHISNNHSDDMCFIYYPEEKVLMVVDIISLRRMPWNTLGWYDPEAVNASIELALSFNADIVVPGHGDIGDAKDLVDFYSYLQALKAGVAAGIASGQSLDEIKKTLLLEDYSEWGMYKVWRTTNIEGMYAHLTRGN